MVTTDGFTINRGRETEGVEAFGYADEVRVDTTKAPKTISTVALEADKRELLEMVLGQDLSAVKANANGEVTFDEVSIPLDIEYDAVLLTRDVQKANGAFEPRTVRLGADLGEPFAGLELDRFAGRATRRTAIALDAAGAAPVQGSRLGDGQERLDVDVTVQSEE